jgi:hypothetical protein
MTYRQRIKLCLGGLFLWVVGPSLIGFFYYPIRLNRYDFLAALPLAFVVGLRIHNIGRKIMAKAFESATNAIPQGEFVLYLRSFQDDEPSAALTWKGGILSPETKEESLLRLLSRFGPVVAVGKPGEKLPYLGARRLYYPDNEWQSNVEQMIEKATLIVIRAGLTRGVLWELESLRQKADARRVLILLPFGEDRYHQFRNSARSVLRLSLPRWPKGKIGPRGLDVQAAILFASDWKPTLLILESLPWPLAARAAIQDVLQRVGNAIQRPYTFALLVRRLLPITSRWGLLWLALWPGILLGGWAMSH